MSLNFCFDYWNKQGHLIDRDTTKIGFRLQSNDDFYKISNLDVTSAILKESGSAYNREIDDFQDEFILNSPRWLWLKGSVYYLPLEQASYYQSEFTDSYIRTKHYLSDNYSVSGKKIGSLINRDNFTVSYKQNNYQELAKAYIYEDFSKSGKIENRKNAYVFYIPVYYNHDDKKTRYEIYVLLKKDTKIETDCCIDAEMYPDKYILKV